MVRIWDISLPVSPTMLTWPGDPPVQVTPAARIAGGDVANVSELRLGSHTGTHVDPPFHFIDGAAASGGVGPTKQSWPQPPRRDQRRVDIEVQAGRAFI